MVTVLLFILLGIVATIFYYHGQHKGARIVERRVGFLRAEQSQLTNLLTGAQEDWANERKRTTHLESELRKVKSQKKSSEVRTGLIAEQLAPFLDGFPYDPKGDIVFVGAPIDFLVYSEDGIHFVEVKSGNAQLSTKQRRIRDHIEAGRVTFEVYRIKGK